MSTEPAHFTPAISAIDAPSERRTHPMIYLDNAATSFPKPESVYQALDRFAQILWPILVGPGTAWP